jgi:hypothetical protein
VDIKSLIRKLQHANGTAANVRIHREWMSYFLATSTQLDPRTAGAFEVSSGPNKDGKVGRN